MFRHRGLGVALSTCAVVFLLTPSAPADIIGFKTTPDASGLHATSKWASPPAGTGFRIDWTISQNPSGTWHYEYVFTNENHETLPNRVSHIILQLSDDAGEADIFNIGGDVSLPAVFGTFGEHPSNPGFPVGESIYGVKFNMGGAQATVEFDSTRQPMWGDFYSKNGKDPQEGFAWVYNVDLGVAPVNPGDYTGTPVDGNGMALHKILTPDTVIPEPASSLLGFIGLAAVALIRRWG